MSQVAPQLVGRPVELGVFDDVLAQLADGRSAAIELVGEPGIGKTRLLEQLATRADARGFLVLSGSASELERDLPFWLFVDALDEYVGAIDPRQLETLDLQTLGELAHVFASLSDRGSAEAPLLRDERYRTHRPYASSSPLWEPTSRSSSSSTTCTGPIPGSIELLGALLRRPPPVPMLVAMGVRPRQASERLAAAFERAHRVGRLARLQLGPLEPRRRARIARRRGAMPGSATALYEETGGNPFYLEQLARAHGRGGTPSSPVDDMLVAVEVPRAVVAALTEELGLLADDARLVLQAAAVAGDPFEPELVAAAADVAEGPDGRRTGRAARSRPRSPDRGPAPIPIPAPARASSGVRRLAGGLETAAALRRRARRPWRVGIRTCPPRRALRPPGRCRGDRRPAPEPAGAVAQRTPAGAARWFGSALRLLRDDAPAEERVELLTALAGARAATGQFEEARAALLESIELLPPDSGALRVPLTAACAGIEQLLGRHAEAHARLEGSLAALDDQRSPPRRPR